MLLVWTTLLVPAQQVQLRDIDPRVHFWPRSWEYSLAINHGVPGEWWISFSHSQYGVVWLLYYPEHSRVVYPD